MLIQRLRLKHLHEAVVVVFALLAIVSPLGDALVFGPHDHVAGADSGAPSQWITPGDSDLTPAHHCELSMSPIGLALALEIPLLRSSGPVAPAPSMPAPLPEPLVQLSPPRA